MRIFRKLCVILVLLFLSISFLTAEDFKELYHIIAYYSFEIKGKSSEKLIREMVVPTEGDVPFKSEAALVKALEEKRNKLNNLRVFEEVSYTYEAIHADNTAIRYRVKFFIDDAFTFLPIPYPKYDSNYGFRVGVKAYDKNLFGTFADLFFVVNATQIESSWTDWDWYSEMRITGIPAWNGDIDIYGEFEAVQSEGPVLKDVFYSGNIDWKGIPLAQTTLDFNVDLAEITSTSSKFDRTLTTSATWANLPWFNSKLRVKPSFTFVQDDIAAPWNIDSASFYSSVNPIRVNGEEYVFSNTMTLKFPHQYIRSNSSLRLSNAKLFGLPLSFWMSADNRYHMDNQQFYNNTYTVGTSLGFSLPFKSEYKGSYEVSVRDGFDTTTTAIEHVPLLSTTQTLSFGRVNWEDNFRKGMKGSIRADADYALFDRTWNNDYLSYSVQGQFETYLKFGKRLGISARGMGFYSDVPSFDWYSGQSFPEFLPDGEVSASEALRGILDKSYEKIVGEDDYQKLGGVVNIDATLMFIKFKNFAEGFMSAFMDVGVFTTAVGESSGSNTVSSEDLIILKTVGIEGYGILDKFPSYPIRGSLGFNLDDVVSHFNGEIAFSDIEFELTVGMGLHY